MSIDTKAIVSDGVVERVDGLNFGGRYFFPAGDGEAESVELAVWTSEIRAFHVKLHVGDNFEFDGQTWRLDEIVDDGRHWYATLTRVA
jgi:Family of unknown function (DUF6406)